MTRIVVKTLSGEPVVEAVNGPISVAQLSKIVAGARSSETHDVPQFICNARVLNDDEVVGEDADLAEEVVGEEAGPADVELNVVWLTGLQAANNDLKNAHQMLERAEDMVIESETLNFEADFLEAAGQFDLTAEMLIGKSDEKAIAAQSLMEDAKKKIVKAQENYRERACECWQLLLPKVMEGHCPRHCQRCWCTDPKLEFDMDFGTTAVNPAAEKLGIPLTDEDMQHILDMAWVEWNQNGGFTKAHQEAIQCKRAVRLIGIRDLPTNATCICQEW